jgi:hypothetical protein
MVYTVDASQLLRIWTVIRYLGELREITDPNNRSKVLMEAQIVLTTFVLDLKPLSGDENNATAASAGRKRTTNFDG